MIARVLVLTGLGWALGFVLFAVTLPRPAGLRVTDAIVVPTGGQGRIARGLELIAAHRARRMLVTGVDRRVKRHELADAQNAPLTLLDCCVDLGREAIDTRSNGEETAAWVKKHRYRSVRLVTTDWHMPRARFELRRALGDGVTIVPDAVPSQPDLATLLREYHKYLLRRVAVVIGL